MRKLEHLLLVTSGAKNKMPKNFTVESVKSKNYIALDTKPKMVKLTNETNQIYSRTLGAGMPMGLLLSLTYPTNITITSPTQ